MPTNKPWYLKSYMKRRKKSWPNKWKTNYEVYHWTSTEKKKRAQRNSARATINKERKSKWKTKLRTNQHVDHKKSSKSSLSNKRSNLRVVSRKKNLSRKKK